MYVRSDEPTYERNDRVANSYGRREREAKLRKLWAKGLMRAITLSKPRHAGTK